MRTIKLNGFLFRRLTNERNQCIQVLNRIETATNVDDDYGYVMYTDTERTNKLNENFLAQFSGRMQRKCQKLIIMVDGK